MRWHLLQISTREERSSTAATAKLLSERDPNVVIEDVYVGSVDVTADCRPVILTISVLSCGWNTCLNTQQRWQAVARCLQLPKGEILPLVVRKRWLHAGIMQNTLRRYRRDGWRAEVTLKPRGESVVIVFNGVLLGDCLRVYCVCRTILTLNTKLHRKLLVFKALVSH